MKKALPWISLLCYIVAVAGCIAHIICDVSPSITTLLLFIGFVVVTLALTGLLTFFSIKDKRKEMKDQDEDSAFDGLNTVEDVNENNTSDELDSVAAVFANEDNEDDEEPDEIDEEDDADDDDDDISAAALTSEEDDSDPVLAKFKRSRFRYSYAAKLIQSDNETKEFYSVVKNAFMSYKKVTSAVSGSHERIRAGRSSLAIIKLRGKTVLLYLALDPAQFENTMYVGQNVSDVVKYADVPFLYRVNGPRKAARAVKLIAMIAEKFGLEPTAEPANENYAEQFPYETTEALVEKGLIIDKVAEAAKKAEQAQMAADEAARNAEKAIDDAIKARENADKAAAKAAAKAEEHNEDIELKATTAEQ